MSAATRKRNFVDRLTAELSRDQNDTVDNVADLFARRVESPSIRRILLAAVEHFSKHGFHGSSTRDIARRAKLSPAAVYVHFRSKEQLLYTVVAIISDWVLDQMNEAARHEGTPPERLRRLVRAHVSSHAAMRNALYLAEYEFNVLEASDRRKILNIRDAIESLFEDCLRAGAADGSFRINNLSLTKVAIVSLCVSVLNWFSPRGELNPEQVGDLYADLVLAMVHAQAPAVASVRRQARAALAR